MNNITVLPEDGWKEITSEASGVFTLSTGGQWCTYNGVPPTALIGHRYYGELINFTLDVGESIYVRVSRPSVAIGDVISGGLCNVYMFDGAEPDYFELLTPFTGDFKLMFAGPSDTGVNSVIVTGRQGDFTASVDALNDPQWNQYHLPSATSLTSILEATATGRIKYALDDVWYSLDVGAPITPPPSEGAKNLWSTTSIWRYL